MLDEPGAVEAEPIGELDLLQRLGEHALLVAVRPGTRHLVLEEQPELHCGPRLSGRANAHLTTVELGTVGALRQQEEA